MFVVSTSTRIFLADTVHHKNGDQQNGDRFLPRTKKQDIERKKRKDNVSGKELFFLVCSFSFFPFFSFFLEGRRRERREKVEGKGREGREGKRKGEGARKCNMR